MANTIEAKVLPFTSPAGDVPGHAILRHDYDWLGQHGGQRDTVSHVLFWTFDREADMPIETCVHWTRWTQFIKRAPERAHTIQAVLLESGRRIHATTYSVSHYGAPAYYRAPILARGIYRITTLHDRRTLLEVAGVDAWARSKRQAEDAALIYDPWARDNAAFAERMAAAQRAT